MLSCSTVLPARFFGGGGGGGGGGVPVRYRPNAVSSEWSLGRKLVMTGMHDQVMVSC